MCEARADSFDLIVTNTLVTSIRIDWGTQYKLHHLLIIVYQGRIIWHYISYSDIYFISGAINKVVEEDLDIAICIGQVILILIVTHRTVTHIPAIHYLHA